LANGAVGDHVAAIQGAVEGVVEAFTVFAPAVAPVVDTVAVVGLDVLAKMLGPAEANPDGSPTASRCAVLSRMVR